MSGSLAILGAGGFVGSRLIEALVLSGHEDVRAVVRSYKSMAGFCRFGAAVDVRLADAEVADKLAKALDGAETVVNLTTGVPAGIVRSTSAIHEACRRAGVKRFIHLSSAVVYGDVEKPTGDDDPPVSKHWMPYARAKGASELWLRDRLEGDVDVVLLRPGIVWGVRSPHTIGFARSLCAKSAFLVDEGRGIFNGIYIDNLVASIRTAADAPGRAAGFYNVGDRETVTWRAFYDALGGPLGCDASNVPKVSGERFQHSVGSRIDAIQSLGPVNALYHRLKTRIPDGVKAAIKARLAGAYQYERHASAYAAEPPVDRELWHLQRVRHKLPVDKFAARFQYTPPVTFPQAVRKTVAWLDTLGMVQRSGGARERESDQAVTTRR